MKYFSPLLLLLFVLAAQAQKNNDYSPAQYKNGFCRSYYQKIYLEQGANSQANIIRFLKGYIPNLRDKRCTLQLNYKKESLGGIHYSFTQLFKGIPIYQATIKVNLDKANTIQSIFDNTEDVSTWQPDINGANANSVIALHPETQQPVLAQLLTNNGGDEILVAGTDTVFSRSLNMYFAAPDTQVHGNVFRPDPLTSIARPYGGTFVNAHDSDATWLTAQLELVPFRAEYDNGRFLLENPYVHILDFDSPAVAPVTSTVPNFLYTRSQTGFEDVMAFYHLTQYRNYIAGLGFNCADALVIADTHASNGEDNSYYAPGHNPPELHYGTGGVNDAEDADVLIHEYGHYLSAHAAPGTNNGSERISLDEAFGDYNAASYSKSFSTYSDEWVFNWDGHNEFWKGRVVNSTKVYPTDLDGNIYRNSEIWSAVLFSLNGDIGRGVTDSLIIETHYSYEGQISMVDAAQLLINADTLLFNGAHFCPIYQRLYDHGLASFASGTCGITGIDNAELSNRIRFVQGGNSFTILNDALRFYTADIYNLVGEKIASFTKNNRANFRYENAALSTGVYLVNVNTENGMKAFKWLKGE